LLKHSIRGARLVDKSRANYRRLCKRDPGLPPLLPAAGKIEVKDAIRVTLPIVGGEAVYTAKPVGGWRFELEYTQYSRPVAPAAGAGVPPAATIVDQANPDYDALLNLLVGLERRVSAFEARAEDHTDRIAVLEGRASNHLATILDQRKQVADLERRVRDHFERIFVLGRRVGAHAAKARPASNVVDIGSVAAE
jgi:hypothetical protein